MIDRFLDTSRLQLSYLDYPVYPEHPIDSDWKRNPYSPV